MFTGIVAEVGKVISIQPDRLSVGAVRILNNLELGNSVAVNGACLTITEFTANRFTAGLSTETLLRTNLRYLRTGELVNLERPLVLGGELGGHLVQGHVDGTGSITAITPSGGSTVFKFDASQNIMQYLVEKGFITVDGISLTVTGRETSSFQISVIDYTKANTNLGNRKIGDRVNLEVDIMAKYAERFIQTQRNKLSEEYLKANGF